MMLHNLRERIALALAPWLTPVLLDLEDGGGGGIDRTLTIELEDGPLLFTSNGGNLTWKKTG